jgi:hypothetical protein
MPKAPTHGYYVDLGTFSLERLKGLLKRTRLLPSQRVLGERLDERFACLEQNGIANLRQLQEALKTKRAIQSFAAASGLPVDYLTVLRREVNSYQPKPIKLSDFPGVDPEVISRLEQAGIKHTKHLFPHVLTPQDRTAFAERHEIAHKDLLDLTKLTDVARLKWVGPKFARLLTESGYDTVAKVAGADYQDLYCALLRANEQSSTYGGTLGENDLKLWVEVVVQDVPQVIQY